MNYFMNLINQFSDCFNAKYTTKAEALPAVESDGSALEYASYALRNDREVVLAAVTSISSLCTSALKYTSDDLRRDKEVVMAVVKHVGHELAAVSNEFKKDKDIVLQAMRSDINSKKYAKLSKEDMRWVWNQLPANKVVMHEQADAKILGTVGMFVDSVRRSCGMLDKDCPSKDADFPDYYKTISKYISVYDISILSQLSTNHYVDDKDINGNEIKRAPNQDEEFKVFIDSANYPLGIRG